MKVFRLAALALLAPCAALGNVTDGIEATGGAVIPSVGLSIDIVGNSAVQNHTSSSHAIDMGFYYARARRTQDVENTDVIVFGGRRFTSGQDIKWTSNIQLAHVGYRPRFWFGQSQFALEGLLGVGYAGLGLKGEADNGEVAAERMSNGGIVLGLGGIWRFASATSLQVRGMIFGSGKDEGVTSASRWDLTVTHAFSKNFQLRGGVGFVTAYSAREDNDDNIRKSPVRAGGGGLVLGVDFVF